MATNQQPFAIHAHFPGQLGGRLTLGDSVQQLDDLDGMVVGPLQDRSRKQVETPPAGLTAVIEDRRPIPFVDKGLFEGVSLRTAQAIGVKKRNQKTITSFRIQEIAQGKIHRAGSLPAKTPSIHARP